MSHDITNIIVFLFILIHRTKSEMHCSCINWSLMLAIYKSNSLWSVRGNDVFKFYSLSFQPEWLLLLAYTVKKDNDNQWNISRWWWTYYQQRLRIWVRCVRTPNLTAMTSSMTSIYPAVRIWIYAAWTNWYVHIWIIWQFFFFNSYIEICETKSTSVKVRIKQNRINPPL